MVGKTLSPEKPLSKSRRISGMRRDFLSPDERSIPVRACRRSPFADVANALGDVVCHRPPILESEHVVERGANSAGLVQCRGDTIDLRHLDREVRAIETDIRLVVDEVWTLGSYHQFLNLE